MLDAMDGPYSSLHSSTPTMKRPNADMTCPSPFTLALKSWYVLLVMSTMPLVLVKQLILRNERICHKHESEALRHAVGEENRQPLHLRVKHKESKNRNRAGVRQRCHRRNEEEKGEGDAGEVRHGLAVHQTRN